MEAEDLILEMCLEGQATTLEEEDKVSSPVEEEEVIVPVTSAVGWQTTTAVWEASSAILTMSRSAREWTAPDARLSHQSSARPEGSPCVGSLGCQIRQ